MHKPPLIGVVQCTWLPEYTDRVAGRCIFELEERGFKTIHSRVPNVLSMAYAIQRLSDRYPTCAAFAAVAAIQFGETRHADFVVNASLKALSEAMSKLQRPIICEFLLTTSIEQLEVRSGEGEMNRGAHAARDILAMLEFEHSIAHGDCNSV